MKIFISLNAEKVNAELKLFKILYDAEPCLYYLGMGKYPALPTLKALPKYRKLFIKTYLIPLQQLLVECATPICKTVGADKTQIETIVNAVISLSCVEYNYDQFKLFEKVDGGKFLDTIGGHEQLAKIKQYAGSEVVRRKIIKLRNAMAVVANADKLRNYDVRY